MIRRLIQFAWGMGAAVVLLFAVLLVRTFLFQLDERGIDPAPELALREGTAERLSSALRYPTISPENPSEFDGAAFNGLHEYLQTAFPRVHAELRPERIAQYRVLYTWRGSDPELAPILLMSHLDVVPIESATAEQWREGPFSGHLVDGYIWGRGAIDNKSTVVGILEAAEMLIEQGFQPTRTILFAFGHDEEVGGRAGAAEVAAVLRSRGVKLEMVLDEGGVVSDGVLPGVARPWLLSGSPRRAS